MKAIVAFLLGILTVTTTNAIAANTNDKAEINILSKELATCSKLAPNDHTYLVTIEYELTKNKGEPNKFIGITDRDSLKSLNKKQSDDIEPFVNCIKIKLKDKLE